MDFDDDGPNAIEDVDLGLGPKKKAAAAGRRRGGPEDGAAGGPRPPPANGGWGDVEPAAAPSAAPSSGPAPPPPAASEGFMSAAPPAPPAGGAAAGPRRKRPEGGAAANPPEDRNKARHEELDKTAAPMEIPELDNTDTRDLTMQVAAPAKVVPANRVQSFRELEDSAGAIPLDTFANTRGSIDLSLLTEVLCPASQVEEADEPWDHELLLNHIQHDMTLETEAAEKEANVGTPAGAAAAGLPN